MKTTGRLLRETARRIWRVVWRLRRLIGLLVLLAGLGWGIHFTSQTFPAVGRVARGVGIFMGGPWMIVKIPDPQFFEVVGSLAIVGVLGLVGFFWGIGILDWLSDGLFRSFFQKKVARNGISRALEKVKGWMHKGLAKKTPIFALVFNMFPVVIPVVPVGEITISVIRVFVAGGALDYRIANIWLLANCVIRSYLWCAIIYHRFY